MSTPDLRKAAKEASSLLLKHGYFKPPIDPEKIAESEGLRVKYADFSSSDSEKYSGFFRSHDKCIIVNNAISSNRITFTIAHELAHYVLHQNYLAENKYTPMPRSNYHWDDKPLEEIEADYFAASLLVPLPMLKDYSAYASISDLAKLFFVSEDVIRNRLDLLRRFPSLASA